MRSMLDVEIGIKLLSANTDTITFDDGATTLVGDNLYLNTFTNSNGKVFNITDLGSKTIKDTTDTVIATITTANAGGDTWIFNEILRGLGSGDSATQTLSATNIAFDNTATDSGLVIDATDYTDSTAEYYPLNEGEGDITFGEYGSRGTIQDANWFAKVIVSGIRRGFMAMAMGLGIPFMWGK